MGKKEVKAKKTEKELRAEIQEELDRYKYKHLCPSGSKRRSFRELRAEYFAKCETGDFQGAWEVSKLYHRRWFKAHR